MSLSANPFAWPDEFFRLVPILASVPLHGPPPCNATLLILLRFYLQGFAPQYRVQRSSNRRRGGITCPWRTPEKPEGLEPPSLLNFRRTLIEGAVVGLGS